MTVPIDDEEPVFAYVIFIGHNHEILTSLPSYTIHLSNDTPIPSDNNTMDRAHGLSRVCIGRRWTREDIIIQHTDTDYLSDRLILIDLGASDYCFVDKSLFTTYKALEQSSVGLLANKRAMFSIIEKRNIKIITNIKDIRRKVKFENMLHIPEMRSNLISLSRLEDKGACFEIGRGKVLVKSPEGEDIMTRACFGQLYVVSVYNPNATAFAAYSKHKVVNFDIWTMFSKGLIDRLNIQGNLEISGLYEDCIFGKYTAYPYNNNSVRERDLLKKIHIDIWGPALM